LIIAEYVAKGLKENDMGQQETSKKKQKEQKEYIGLEKRAKEDIYNYYFNSSSRNSERTLGSNRNT
jgi:hypothetical protein